MTFKAYVTVEHAISMLKAAAERGKFGAFKVSGSSIVATEEYGKTARPTPGNPRVRGVLSIISDRFSFPEDVFMQTLLKSSTDLKKLLYSYTAILKELPLLVMYFNL